MSSQIYIAVDRDKKSMGGKGWLFIRSKAILLSCIYQYVTLHSCLRHHVRSLAEMVQEKCVHVFFTFLNSCYLWFFDMDFTLTLDLSEIYVNVMTQNNGTHIRSPYDPGIQKWPFFLFQTPEKNYLFGAHYLYSLQMTISLKPKKIWGLE